MSITSSMRGNRVTISINEQFDRFSQRAFTKAYQDRPKKASYVVDFKKVNAIDSSALGQLVKFRDHVGGDDADITLINVNDTVRKMLRIANFQMLFSIR